MKTWIFALVFICFSSLAFGQNLTIQEIKDYYYKLKSEMKATAAHSGEFEYVDFYVVEIKENVHGKSMPGVGIYEGVTEKWYLSDEENYGTEGTLVYKKSNFEIAARTEFSEFVFDAAGTLIFCFIKSDDSEFRYYFQKGTLLDYKEKNAKDSDYYNKESWKYLIERAKD